MNFQNTNKILKVVLSVGDESGIGPEIILKALCSNQIPKNIDYILVGSKKNLQNTYEHLRSLGLENLANPKNLKIQDIEICPSNNDSKSSYGDSSFQYLKKLVKNKHYNFFETLAEDVFDELFKDKRIDKISLQIEKLEIMKDCSSVGIQISKKRSHDKL